MTDNGEADGAKTGTITVKGYIGTDNVYKYGGLPTNFGVILGQFINKNIDTDNDGTADAAVKMYDHVGNYSFAPGDGSGICETCHTDTDHYRSNGTGGTDPDHGNASGIASANPNPDFANCVFCHSHMDGFRPSCPDCHGFPPTNQAAAGGPEGLVGPDNVPAGSRWQPPATTDSTTVGKKHALHATPSGYNYTCQTCHAVISITAMKTPLPIPLPMVEDNAPACSATRDIILPILKHGQTGAYQLN